MIFGMSVSTFTTVHVVLSLIGIAAGLVVLFAALDAKAPPGWTALFLVTTILTSATGYFFPADRVLPSHIVGAVSLAVLALAVGALYQFRLAGAWRWIYVVSAVAALYLNVFVAVVQAFLKIAPLHDLAPTQKEPPFAIAQGIVLLAFIAAGFLAVRRFRPEIELTA